jgi:hypothetical protein
MVITLYGGPFSGEQLDYDELPNEIDVEFGEGTASYTRIEGDAAQFLKPGVIGYEFVGLSKSMTSEES